MFQEITCTLGEVVGIISMTTSIATISTNDVYHKVIGMYSWMEEKFTKEWESHKPISWWLHVIKLGWHSNLILRAKALILRIMVGSLPLGNFDQKKNC